MAGAWKDWSVHMEWDVDFDLNEDEIDTLVGALDAPVSWDALGHRLGVTISQRDTPVDSVLHRSAWRVMSVTLQTKDLPLDAVPPMRLEVIEAMTFEEQDRRLGIIIPDVT